MDRNIHTSRTPGDPPALLEALDLAFSGVIGLALHVVIVVVAASGANEEGSRQQRGRTGTQLLDLGNRVGQRRGVVERVLREPVVFGGKSLVSWICMYLERDESM